MKKTIYAIMIILFFTAGCTEKQADKEEPIIDDSNGPVTDVKCDAITPCDEGYECVKLPETATPVCVLPEVLESDKYKDCAVLESYPVQLKCPSQTRPRGGCEADSDCKISGCSGEICAEQEMTSICLYKPEFECYSLTNCKCVNGKCGWEQTKEFLDCVDSKIIS